ncbi:MAG: glycosyltransferase family 4 protein [Desulfobacter sp.]|nr:MAG: glycosyltransferase family 4 protein [Desulfobacter sp.]
MTQNPTSPRKPSPRPLKIAFVIKNFVATGGAERYAVETAQRLLEKGHKIDIYARQIDFDLTKGMGVFKIVDKMRFSSVLSLYSFSKEVKKRLAGRHYDVIHSHDKGCYGHVSTVHTFSFKRGKEKMSLLQKMNEFWISPRAWLYIHMENIQAASQRLAAVSEVIKEDIKKSHHRDKGIAIIPPGVDVEKFCPEKVSALRAKARKDHGLGPDETVVLFVGSEFRRKGLDDLIPALDKKMRLFVVGRQEKTDYYKGLAKELGVSQNLVFTGLVEDVIPYYALADILVLPSVSEAFGMTVLEGMACGLPVVTSAAAGCSCIITSGKNGFVFEKPEQISAMLLALEDKALQKSMGCLARKKAQSCTWDQTALAYEKLYHEAVNR